MEILAVNLHKTIVVGPLLRLEEWWTHFDSWFGWICPKFTQFGLLHLTKIFPNLMPDFSAELLGDKIQETPQ